MKKSIRKVKNIVSATLAGLTPEEIAFVLAEYAVVSMGARPSPLPGFVIEMVRVPGGTLHRGSDDYSDEKNGGEHEIASFEIGKYPVTVGQFRAFADATGYVTGREKNGESQTWKSPGFPQTDTHPVVCVTHEDATAFCKWAGKRLLTEAEWEYAARGTEGRKYSWGNQEPDGSRLHWKASGTCPVGEHPAGASPLGVHDLAGNVWEWTADWYAPYDPARVTGPKQGQCRVLRGGCWDNSSAIYVRAAYRYFDYPTRSYNNVGFRVAGGAK